MLKIYFFVLSIFRYVYSIPYDCTINKTVYLKPGELVYFQTPNYPAVINYCTFYKGRLQFDLNDREIISDKSKLVVLLNHFDINLPVPILEFIIADSFVYLVQSLNVKDSDCAVQGYVFVDNLESTCPMELLSKNIPYLFTDESQIIYIQSGFNNITKDGTDGPSLVYYTRLKPCQWKFAAPFGYGFKIVFTMLNLKSGLLVTNSTDLILNERSARLNFPYYNSDKYLQIDLLKNEETIFNEMEFQAYISVVKTNFDKIDKDCSSGFNGDGVHFWSNKDVNENNFQCRFELIIKPNTEVYIDSRNADLELNADYIIYYTNENDIKLLSYGGDSFNFMTIKGYENGTDKHVYFKYLSDGSIQSYGFFIAFYENTCKCAPTNIKCEGFFNPMGNVDSAYICANLTCVFIIEKCKRSLNQIQFGILGFDINDVLEITSNGETVFSYQVFIYQNNTIKQGVNVYLNNSNYNVLKIHTSNIVLSTSRNCGLISKSYNAISVSRRFTFLPRDPTFIVEVSQFELVTFEISEVNFNTIPNALWTIYAYSECKSKIYNNESLTIPIRTDKCNTFPLFSPCQIKQPGFAIYNDNGEDDGPLKCLYAVTPPGKTKNGCVFENNVHYPDSSKPAYISNIATGKDNCIITVINPRHYISHLWTTAFKENVQIFIGKELNRLLFEFNSKTAKEWKDIYLFANAYTVFVPKNASFFMILTNFEESPYNIKIDSSKLPYKSIINTLFFEEICFNDGKLFNYFIADFPVIFSTIFYNISDENSFYFLIDGKEQTIYNVGNSYIFKNQNFSLKNYCFNYNVQIYNGAIFYIQSINDETYMPF